MRRVVGSRRALRRRALRRRAFSLVELLVVLAIVALLMALLLPMLQKARAQANQTRCLNNIRQVGMGLAMYVNDFKEYPPAEDLPENGQPQATPVYFAAKKTGLLSLSRDGRGFNRFSMACPEGWASSGDVTYYDGKGINRFGAAYMDYAYWGRRYAKTGNLRDVKYMSFKYSAKEKGTKILATDVVADLGGNYGQVTGRVGEGNHAMSRGAKTYRVRCTDGLGARIGPDNVFRSTGTSVLFSDYSAHWFAPTQLTGQTQGLVYPTPDQWNLR